MSNQNYKPKDQVTITKPGKFQSLTGEVISNNELADKPLTVDLSPFGTWSFKLDECEPIGGDRHMIESVGRQGLKNVIASLNKENEALTEKETKSLQQGIKEANAGDIEPIETLFKKRKYTPRGTPKEVKGKRKYNKKPKAI